MGRLELLSWLNEITEIEYPKVEMCCDAIGYCQVLDAIHPGVVQLSKLNFNAKFEGDFSRNLKILDETLSKLSLEKITPIDKLSRGKFQDNIVFIQWLFTYGTKMGLQPGVYPGYQRRLDAIKKQKMKVPTMNSYLIANKEFLKNHIEQGKFEDEEDDGEIPNEFEPEEDEVMTQREHDLENLLHDLESDLKKKMETNWKLLFTIDEVSKERNFFYNLLLQIESLLNDHDDSDIKATIHEYLAFVPKGFEAAEEDEDSNR